MNHFTLTILSNDPPGGRCMLYARYAEELSQSLGLNVLTIYPDDNHEHITPGLLMGEQPVTPADGVIIDPNDIFNTIKQIGLEIADMAGLRNRLDLLVEETIGKM